MSTASAAVYVAAVLGFVADRVGGDVGDLGQLSPGDVTAFMFEVCDKRQPGKAKTTVTALRSLLGFLHLEGVVDASLAAPVPSVASWRLAELPRGLERPEVDRLLGACDRRSGHGRRDFAIILLLVRLGRRDRGVSAARPPEHRAGTCVVRAALSPAEPVSSSGLTILRITATGRHPQHRTELPPGSSDRGVPWVAQRRIGISRTTCARRPWGRATTPQRGQPVTDPVVPPSSFSSPPYSPAKVTTNPSSPSSPPPRRWCRYPEAPTWGLSLRSAFRARHGP